MKFLTVLKGRVAEFSQFYELLPGIILKWDISTSEFPNQQDIRRVLDLRSHRT